MRTFTLIWLGQLVSTIGSYMTEFALTLWAWELTGSATALALIGFFSQAPRIPITLIAGLIVDRFSRKHLMMLGDSIAALSTVSIGILYLIGSLQTWHLYLAASLNGGFGQIQSLAYQTSISSMVSPLQLTRANSMNSAVHYGSIILGPALAGILYPLTGLMGILLTDLATFGVAIATLLTIHIPQLKTHQPTELLWSNLTFGFREVWRQPSLRSLLLITALFWFFHDLGGAIYDPMILARTNGSAQALASTAAAAGIGGITGAIALTAWGGPKRRVHGICMGYIGAGIAKTIFGLSSTLTVWVPAQFCSSLNFPLLGSSEKTLWIGNISPETQGRVFAANSFILQGVSAIASLVAGPLAEGLIEPVIQIQAIAWVVRPLLGTKPGAGITLLYISTSLTLILVGIGGYCLPALRRVNGTISVTHEGHDEPSLKSPFF